MEKNIVLKESKDNNENKEEELEEEGEEEEEEEETELEQISGTSYEHFRVAKNLYDNGVYLSAIRGFQESIGGFQSSRDSLKFQSEVYYWLGRSYESLKRFETAIEQYDKSLEIDGNNDESLKNRAICKQQLGKFLDAIGDINMFIEKNPKEFDGYFWKGRFYFRASQYDLAIEEYSKGIKIVNEKVERKELMLEDVKMELYKMYNNRGFAYEEEGNFEKSIEDYKMSLEMNPNSFMNKHFGGMKGKFGKKNPKNRLKLTQGSCEFKLSIIDLSLSRFNSVLKKLEIPEIISIEVEGENGEIRNQNFLSPLLLSPEHHLHRFNNVLSEMKGEFELIYEENQSKLVVPRNAGFFEIFVQSFRVKEFLNTMNLMAFRSTKLMYEEEVKSDDFCPISYAKSDFSAISAGNNFTKNCEVFHISYKVAKSESEYYRVLLGFDETLYSYSFSKTYFPIEFSTLIEGYVICFLGFKRKHCCAFYRGKLIVDDNRKMVVFFDKKLEFTDFLSILTIFEKGAGFVKNGCVYYKEVKMGRSYHIIIDLMTKIYGRYPQTRQEEVIELGKIIENDYISRKHGNVQRINIHDRSNCFKNFGIFLIACNEYSTNEWSLIPKDNILFNILEYFDELDVYLMHKKMLSFFVELEMNPFRTLESKGILSPKDKINYIIGLWKDLDLAVSLESDENTELFLRLKKLLFYSRTRALTNIWDNVTSYIECLAKLFSMVLVDSKEKGILTSGEYFYEEFVKVVVELLNLIFGVFVNLGFPEIWYSILSKLSVFPGRDVWILFFRMIQKNPNLFLKCRLHDLFSFSARDRSVLSSVENSMGVIYMISIMIEKVIVKKCDYEWIKNESLKFSFVDNCFFVLSSILEVDNEKVFGFVKQFIVDDRFEESIKLLLKIDEYSETVDKPVKVVFFLKALRSFVRNEKNPKTVISQCMMGFEMIWKSTKLIMKHGLTSKSKFSVNPWGVLISEMLESYRDVTQHESSEVVKCLCFENEVFSKLIEIMMINNGSSNQNEYSFRFLIEEVIFSITKANIKSERKDMLLLEYIRNGQFESLYELLRGNDQHYQRYLNNFEKLYIRQIHLDSLTENIENITKSILMTKDIMDNENDVLVERAMKLTKYLSGENGDLEKNDFNFNLPFEFNNSTLSEKSNDIGSDIKFEANRGNSETSFNIEDYERDTVDDEFKFVDFEFVDFGTTKKSLEEKSPKEDEKNEKEESLDNIDFDF